MRSISIVHSELQLMNCIEGVSHYKTDKNILVIASLTNRNDKIEYVNNIYSHGLFSRVINLRLIRNSSAFFYHLNFLYSILVISFITIFCKFDFYFFGNYMEFVQRYLLYKSRLYKRKCNVILVDDGTATLRFVTVRRSEFRSGKGYFDRSISVFAKCIPLSDRKAQIPLTITYFTSYNLSNILEFDKIEKNDYQCLSHMDSHVVFEDKSLFVIGQPLVEAGVISKTDYIGILSHIVKYDSNKKYYCPHPDEKNVSDIEELGYIILRNKETFEIVSMALPSSSVIIGFYSSALLNVKFIRKELLILYVDISKLLKRDYYVNADVANTYKYLSEYLIKYEL